MTCLLSTFLALCNKSWDWCLVWRVNGLPRRESDRPWFDCRFFLSSTRCSTVEEWSEACDGCCFLEICREVFGWGGLSAFLGRVFWIGVCSCYEELGLSLVSGRSSASTSNTDCRDDIRLWGFGVSVLVPNTFIVCSVRGIETGNGVTMSGNVNL